MACTLKCSVKSRIHEISNIFSLKVDFFIVAGWYVDNIEEIVS